MKMETTTHVLIEQINKGKGEYLTDTYSMSIGELISMYKEEELIINPEFQRMFRWTIRQQSRLIESILIGVPLPSIFVYQNEKGKWEVVDGVQRISTILAFVGVLRPNDNISENNEEITIPSVLEKTKMLPALGGMTWEKLPKEPLQLDFRRSKIDIKIIKYLSDKNAKFEVFQRLNSGGSLLSDQEFRNCLLIMVNRDFYRWILELSSNRDFITCIDLSERLIQEKYDQELVLRLIVFAGYNFTQKTVGEFIDDSIFGEEENSDSIIHRISNKTFDIVKEKEKFEKTFRLLALAKNSDTFKKMGPGQRFIESYFEAIGVGLYYNVESYNETDIELIRQKIEKIETYQEFTTSKGNGTNSTKRIPKTTKFGKNYFKK
jgi:hypothetical protein